MQYRILGSDLQVLEIGLAPEEGVIAEAGSLCWIEDGVNFEAKMGDGSDTHSGLFSRALSTVKRDVTGAGVFLTHFTNQSQRSAQVALSAPYPGKILAVPMGELGTNLICQKGVFLCASDGVHLDLYFNRKIGSGFFSGDGFLLQRLQGRGTVFIHAGGVLVERELRGECLRVDPGCVAGFTEGLDFDIQPAGNLKTMLFGGVGLFLATLRGSGKVYLQSLPLSRLADHIMAPRSS